MGIYTSLAQETKDAMLKSLVNKAVAYITNKGNITIPPEKYECVINETLNNCTYGRFDSENLGRKAKCLDLLVYDNELNKKIALQIKSANDYNDWIKVYQMDVITKLLFDDMTGEEVLDYVIDTHNQRYLKEKAEYQFQYIESLTLIKGRNTIFIYENDLGLETFDRKKAFLISYNPKGYIIFKYNDITYRFTFTNHTLYEYYVKTLNYVDSVTSYELLTCNEIAKQVTHQYFLNGEVADRNAPFQDKFNAIKNHFSSLAILISTQDSVVYKNTEIQFCENFCGLNYVEKEDFILVLKNSLIKKTSKLYEELLKLGAVSRRGILNKDIKLLTFRDIKKYLL